MRKTSNSHSLSIQNEMNSHKKAPIFRRSLPEKAGGECQHCQVGSRRAIYSIDYELRGLNSDWQRTMSKGKRTRNLIVRLCSKLKLGKVGECMTSPGYNGPFAKFWLQVEGHNTCPMLKRWAWKGQLMSVMSKMWQVKSRHENLSFVLEMPTFFGSVTGEGFLGFFSRWWTNTLIL